MDSPRQFYSQEEVHGILEVAIARQAERSTQTELTRAQLLEIAADMGISPMDLELAERSWAMAQGEAQERQAFDRYLRERLQHRVVRYLIVNGALGAIAWLSTNSLLGVPLIMLFWGMFLALDVWNTFGTKGDRYEAAFQKWRRRRRLKRGLTQLVERFLPR